VLKDSPRAAGCHRSSKPLLLIEAITVTTTTPRRILIVQSVRRLLDFGPAVQPTAGLS
jgi:hypothetical protein